MDDSSGIIFPLFISCEPDYSKMLEKYVFLKIICRHESVWVVQIMLLLLLIFASSAQLFKICVCYYDGEINQVMVSKCLNPSGWFDLFLVHLSYDNNQWKRFCLWVLPFLGYQSMLLRHTEFRHGGAIYTFTSELKVEESAAKLKAHFVYKNATFLLQFSSVLQIFTAALFD